MNPQGAIPFEAGGRTHKLRLGINAICLLEDRLGKSIGDVALEFEMNPRIGTIRALFWAGVGDAEMTTAQAGDLVEELGIKRAAALARQALKAAFPDPEPARDGADTRPPVAAAG